MFFFYHGIVENSGARIPRKYQKKKVIFISSPEIVQNLAVNFLRQKKDIIIGHDHI